MFPIAAALYKVLSAQVDNLGLPPAPGTAPIPEGHIRFFHNTWARHVPSIEQHGLLERHAKGDGGLGAGNEPSAGVWAATGHAPGDDKLEGPHSESERPIVEFHAHPSQISDRADSPWNSSDKQEWGKGYHHVIMHGDVKPDQIVAIHHPWHSAARYMAKDGGHKQYSWLKDPAQNEGLDNYVKAYDHLEAHSQQHEAARTAMSDQDYRIQHQGPDAESGEALHEIGQTGNGYPKDVLQHPDWYGLEHPRTHRVILQAQGNPEARVSVYRGLPHPHRTINTGDWVSIAPEYARQHGFHPDDPEKDWPVIHTLVKAKHLRNDGNTLEEWSYHGPTRENCNYKYKGGKNSRQAA